MSFYRFCRVMSLWNEWKDLRIVEDLRRFKPPPPPQPQEFVTLIRFWLWNDSREKCLFFFYNLSVLYIYDRGGGGVARLIYAQYAHLYYYGLWMRSTRINLIESSMCHKNPETERETEQEREGRWTETAAKPSGNCHALAKWQAKPRLVDVAPTTTTAFCGKWVAISWLDWLVDWVTEGRTESDWHSRDSAAIWHCLYRLLIRCTICIYI